MTLIPEQNQAPLADRMRPRTLDEFIGQRHLVGEGRLLRRAIEADRLTSSIFYGPPGCGKTTLASIIARATSAAFVQLNAVTSGVADVRDVLKAAKERRMLTGQATYLLLDECHRWSKAQSDSILPAIEGGTIRFIGSTTENPMVAMTPAIVSRCRVFQFFPLTEADVMSAMGAPWRTRSAALVSWRWTWRPRPCAILRMWPMEMCAWPWAQWNWRCLPPPPERTGKSMWI